jgi:alkaline phosphatase D
MCRYLFLFFGALLCAFLISGCSHCNATASFRVSADQSCPKLLRKLAFGSCNKDDKPQPLWDAIVSYDPDIWLWIGDVVYGDWSVLPGYYLPGSSIAIKGKLQHQKENHSYQRLANRTTILGIWDDHDYGKNNGGKEQTEKKIVQQYFLDFLDEPADSIRRNREGLYASYTFGPRGSRVKLILLDTRYFRDFPKIIPSTLRDGEDDIADLLGEQQWRWLEQQLTDSDAQLHVITSGIQILPTDKPFEEKWGNFPESRRRLFELIARHHVSGLLLLSGDVHYAEILSSDRLGLGYRVYEVTSSGMTHSCGSFFSYKICHFILNGLLKSRYRDSDFFEYFNFGTIDIDWDSNPVTLRLQVRDETNRIALEKVISLSALQSPMDPSLPPYSYQEDSIPIWINYPMEFWRDIGYIIILILFGWLVLLSRNIFQSLQPGVHRLKIPKKES